MLPYELLSRTNKVLQTLKFIFSYSWWYSLICYYIVKNML